MLEAAAVVAAMAPAAEVGGLSSGEFWRDDAGLID